MRISILLLVMGAVTANEIVFPNTNTTGNWSLMGMASTIANLGLKILRELSDESNVIISPLNVYSLLGILSLGASGETKEEISGILGEIDSHPITVSQMIKSNKAVSHSSALFFDDNFVPTQEFTERAFANFDASVIHINTTDGLKAKDTINSWVAEHTNQTILNLLQDSLHPATKMVVVSALLFNGKWLHAFQSADIQPGKFEIKEDLHVEVPLMRMVATVPLIRNSLLDAISLPYKEEGMIMHFILPKVRGLQQIKKILSHINFNSLKKFRNATQEEILLIIPKMKLEGRVSLSNTLAKYGLKTMFDPIKANFSAASENSSGLFVSEVYHSIHFEVDESGTSASAVSASILTKSKKFVFRADRPFIFTITDESDIILFMGIITNPLE